MKKFILFILVSLFLLTNVNAETFSDALKKTYNNNPELNAERESLNISEQEYKISASSYFPSVTLSGSKSQEDTDKLTNRNGSNATITDVDPTVQSITITQTLIDFGRSAELKKSKIGIELARAKLLKKEQDILYKSIKAYTGLVTANEKLKINRSNVNLLDRQVETDRIRLERGNISLSDVAQSESSLAGAQAKLIQAENDFLTSKLNYENVIGKLNDPELFQTIRQFEKNNRPALADKMRALRHPDWAAANFGEDYMTVLERGQTRELLNKIDPNIKERTILDDIDDMNKANIDELFGGRKRNADGGLAKILEV